MGSYVMYVLPWKQSRALIREYTTVLHMHRPELASILGPGYSTRVHGSVGRGVMVNASNNEMIST